MSFTLPKLQRRKRIFCAQDAPFPIPIATQTNLPPSNSRWYYYVAYLVDGSIFVKHSGDMDQLYKMGFFGKGTLSKHRPQYGHVVNKVNWPVDDSGHQRSLKIISKRKFLRRAAWARLELSTCEEEIELPLAKKAQEASAGQGRICDIDVKDSRSSGGHLSSGGDSKTDAERRDAGSEILKERKAKRIRLDEDGVDEDGDGGSEEQTIGSPSEDNHGAEGEDRRSWTEGDQEIDPWSVTTQKEAAEFWAASDSSVTDEAANAKQDEQQPVCCDTPDDGGGSHWSDTVRPVLGQPDDGTQPSATPVNCTARQRSEETKRSASPPADTGERECSWHATKDEQLMAGILSPTSVALATTGRDVAIDNRSYHLDRRCLMTDDDGELLVVDDTDDSDVDVTMDTRLPWQPVAKRDPYEVREYLQLSLEEAFFLTYALGCLILYDENQVALNIEQMWQSFCKMEPNFLARYAAYHNFRSKGWVPKSGLKYGTDFVIYKEGPPFYHSTYSVLVKRVSADCLIERHQGMERSTTWTSLSAINRVTEQVAKNLMFCYVIEPDDLTELDILSPASLSRFRVQEVVVNRMMSKQERDNAEYVMIP